jgi:hypothetical protein
VVAAIIEEEQEFHTTRPNGPSRLDVSRYDAAVNTRVGKPISEARSRPRIGVFEGAGFVVVITNRGDKRCGKSSESKKDPADG